MDHGGPLGSGRDLIGAPELFNAVNLQDVQAPGTRVGGNVEPGDPLGVLQVAAGAERFDNPHIYKVDLSKDLWELKNNLLKETIQISKKQKTE